MFRGCWGYSSGSKPQASQNPMSLPQAPNSIQYDGIIQLLPGNFSTRPTAISLLPFVPRPPPQWITVPYTCCLRTGCRISLQRQSPGAGRAEEEETGKRAEKRSLKSKDKDRDMERMIDSQKARRETREGPETEHRRQALALHMADQDLILGTKHDPKSCQE